MSLTKVPQQAHEKPDVRHWVQKVGVFQLLRKLKAHRLHEATCALAVLANQLVVYHVASATLQVLHLVGYHPLVQDVKETALHVVLAQ